MLAYALLVAILGMGWFGLHLKLAHEQSKQEAAEARAAALKTKVNALNEYSVKEATLKQKKTMLAGAMVNDVAWSRMLKEFAMITPDGTWLTGLTGTAQAAVVAQTSAPAPAAGTVPPATAGTGQAVAAVPAVSSKPGSMTFAGVTGDFPGVAKWITTLQEQDHSVGNVFVPSAAKALVGTRQMVNYTSTADLSSQALSGRYQSQGGL